MECKICFESIGEAPVSLPCGHIYCQSCTSRLARDARPYIRCPTCRARADIRVQGCLRRVFFDLSPSDPSPQATTQDLSRDIENLRDVLDLANNNNRNLRAQNDLLQTTHESLEASLSVARSEARMMAAQIRDLNNHLRNERSTTEYWRHTVSVMQDRINELEASLRSSTRQVESSGTRNSSRPANNVANDVSSVVRVANHQISRTQQRTEPVVVAASNNNASGTRPPLRASLDVSELADEESSSRHQNPRSQAPVIPPGAVFYKGVNLPKEHTFSMMCSGGNAANDHEYYRHDINGSGSNQYIKRYKCQKCNHRFEKRS